MGRLLCSYPDCDKTFKYKCNLKKHIRVHSSALKAQMNVANNVQYASKQKTFQKTKACEFVLRDPLTLPELNSYNKATDEGLLIDTKEQEKTQKSICTRILKDKVKHTKKSKLYKQTKHSKTDPRETNLHIQGELLKTEFSDKIDTRVPTEAEARVIPRKNPILTKLILSLSKRGVQAFPKISATKNQQEIKVGQTNSVKESREDVWRDEPVVGNNVLEENCTKEVKDEPKQTIKDFFNDDEANEEKAKMKEYFSDDVKDLFDDDIKDLFDDFAADDDEPHIFYHNGNPIGKYHPLS